MAKITKDQVNKINAKCKNGFTLSLYTAIIHGEKCPVLDIEKYVPCKTENMYQVLDVRSEKLGEIVNRRSMKALQDLTADYPDEKLISLIREVIAA